MEKLIPLAKRIPSPVKQILRFTYHGLWQRLARHRIPARLLVDELPTDARIVEAGAHRGEHTLQFSEQWPQGHIYAFEPVPAIFATLQNRMAERSNVTCYPYALAASSGSATLHVSAGESDESSSLLPPQEHLLYHPGTLFVETVSVPTVTLDEWAAAEGVSRVDALWLDLQGYELPVMQASPRLLAQVQWLVTEFSHVELYAGQPRFADLRAWLKRQGFACVQRENLWVYGGDAVFKRVKAK